MSEADTLLRAAVYSDVTEAYDNADHALHMVRKIAPDVAGLVETARDLLFAARLRLADE